MSSTAASKNNWKNWRLTTPNEFSNLRERVATDENPRRLGKALVGKQFANLWRYRVGDYRIICRIEDQRRVILVVKLGHRRDIYK